MANVGWQRHIHRPDILTTHFDIDPTLPSLALLSVLWRFARQTRLSGIVSYVAWEYRLSGNVP